MLTQKLVPGRRPDVHIPGQTNQLRPYGGIEICVLLLLSLLLSCIYTQILPLLSARPAVTFPTEERSAGFRYWTVGFMTTRLHMTNG